MIYEIPPFCLRAYALFFLKHGSKEPFRQSELDWIVSQSMKKKIFSLLLHAGWIRKESKTTYACVEPEQVTHGLLEFKVPTIIKNAARPYAFTGMSAVEIWSDYSYMQRGIEKSPYSINVLNRDVPYWKQFFSTFGIPVYIRSGSTIGEYVILIPIAQVKSIEKDGIFVEPFKKTLKIAKENEMYQYAYRYMRKRYGTLSNTRKRNI